MVPAANLGLGTPEVLPSCLKGAARVLSFPRRRREGPRWLARCGERGNLADFLQPRQVKVAPGAVPFSLPTGPDQSGPRGAMGFGLQALRVLRDEEIDPAAPRAWPALISSGSCARLATLISLLLISCGVCT